MISALEDERTAKKDLSSAALNKDDVLVSVSLVKASLPLSDPRRPLRLKFALLDPGKSRAPLSDSRQCCERSGLDIVCKIDAGRSVVEDGRTLEALLPSNTVQSRDPMIRKLAQSIAAHGESATEK